MSPIFLIAAAAAGIFFATKKPRAAENNDFVIPDIPISESENEYIPPVQEKDVRNTYTTSQSKPQSASSAATSTKPKINALKPATTQRGQYFAYNKELADGIHRVNLIANSNIGVVDTKVSIGIFTFKNIPAGQTAGVYSGKVYQSSSGSRYLVANGYRSGLYYYVPIKNAVISTKGNNKRIIVKDMKKGEYIIS
jgi:hypothetical protein